MTSLNWRVPLAVLIVGVGIAAAAAAEDCPLPNTGALPEVMPVCETSDRCAIVNTSRAGVKRVADISTLRNKFVQGDPLDYFLGINEIDGCRNWINEDTLVPQGEAIQYRISSVELVHAEVA